MIADAAVAVVTAWMKGVWMKEVVAIVTYSWRERGSLNFMFVCNVYTSLSPFK